MSPRLSALADLERREIRGCEVLELRTDAITATLLRVWAGRSGR